MLENVQLVAHSPIIIEIVEGRMSVLQAKGITKIFPGVVALDKVDLTIESGEVHCIVGENGAGKSTLVKILTGLYQADEGSLIIEGKEVNRRDPHSFKTVAYVPQELNLFGELTVAENLFAPFDKAGLNSLFFDRKKYERATLPYIEKLQMKVKPHDLVKNISVADQQLLQVARALSNESFKILILDEPTASLTKQEIARLFLVINILRKEGKSLVFITHKLNEIFELNDVITVLRNGVCVGNAKVKDITVDWIVKSMTGKEIDLNKVYKPTKPLGEKVLEVKNLCGNGFEDISFSLREGEIFGFAGLVGSGRSEIMQTIFGYLPEKHGEVIFGGSKWKFRDPAHSIAKGLIYLSEERKTHGILPHLSVRDNIGVLLSKMVARRGIINRRLDEKVAQKVMKDYNVKAASSKTEIMYLSGGNQQKVLIGRSMEAMPRVLFFDEPTRGIDVKTKEEIYALMQQIAEEKRAGIILISSELEELIKCSNRIITIYDGRIVGEFQEKQINMEDVLSSIIGITQVSMKPGGNDNASK
jgi:ribose transport system ATP-binding protein